MPDVLIITALPLEFQAARDAGLALGIGKWRSRTKYSPLPYLSGYYALANSSLSVALWDSTRMGSPSVGSVMPIDPSLEPLPF